MVTKVRASYIYLQILKSAKHYRLACSDWPVGSCRTSGFHCSSGLPLRVASVQPRGSGTFRQTRAASVHPNKRWRCSSGWHALTPCLSYLKSNLFVSQIFPWIKISVSSCALPTFNQVVVGFSPGVAVLWSQNANRLLVRLQWGVPDLLQLHV